SAGRERGTFDPASADETTDRASATTLPRSGPGLARAICFRGDVSEGGRSPLRVFSARRWEPRRALLADGADPLAHVRAHEVQHLEREALVEDGACLPQPVVERALRPADRVLASLRELRRHLPRFR